MTHIAPTAATLAFRRSWFAAAGSHHLSRDGRDDARHPLAPGAYLCQLRTVQGGRRQRLLLLC